MKKAVLLLGILTFYLFPALGQKADKIITEAEVSRILKTLSADDMEGRRTFTPGIEKAAAFISNEFTKAGIQKWEAGDYQQRFAMIKQKNADVRIHINGEPIAASRVLALVPSASFEADEKSGLEQVYIDETPNLFRSISPLLSQNKPTIIWLSDRHTDMFKRLGMLANRPMMQGAAPLIIVLHEKADRFQIQVTQEVEEQHLANVVGVIPGKSKKDEYVVFSAHYDHLGIGKPDAKGDSIYNGANDDASGTTAVIMLAKYFQKLAQNERTLVFVAFTAEEIGGYGSRYFSQNIDPDKVTAMFNIEMIGTDSKWGLNSAYITGYEKSDFGKILQKNLEGSKFRFEPDPYPEQQLFYRSDNATLAALGVPAHTISTSKMDNEPHYHKPSDEFETLDVKNMTEVIKGIAVSSRSIVAGKDTPSRVVQE